MLRQPGADPVPASRQTMTSLMPLNALVVVESPRLTALLRHSRPADGICQEFHRRLAVLWQPPFKETLAPYGRVFHDGNFKTRQVPCPPSSSETLLPSNVPTAATVPVDPPEGLQARKRGPVFSGCRPFVRIFRIVTFPAYWWLPGPLGVHGLTAAGAS